MDERCRDGLELEKQQQQDEQQADGYYDGQPFGGPYFLLVIARKFPSHSGREFNLALGYLFVEVFGRLLHNVHFSLAADFVEDDIAHQKGVFAANHLCTTRIVDVGDFPQGNLYAVHGRNQDAFERFRVVAKFPGVPNTDGKTFPPFHGGRKRHSAYCGLQNLLHIGYAHAVAGHVLAVELDFHIRRTHGTVVKYGGALNGRHVFQRLLKQHPRFFNGLQIRAIDLQSHRRPHPCGKHDQPRFDGLQLGG